MIRIQILNINKAYDAVYRNTAKIIYQYCSILECGLVWYMATRFGRARCVHLQGRSEESCALPVLLPTLLPSCRALLGLLARP
jgi:hypothetical protein